MIPTDSDPKIAAQERMRRKLKKKLLKTAKSEAKDDQAIGTFSKFRLKNLAYQKLNTRKNKDKLGI